MPTSLHVLTPRKCDAKPQRTGRSFPETGLCCGAEATAQIPQPRVSSITLMMSMFFYCCNQYGDADDEGGRDIMTTTMMMIAIIAMRLFIATPVITVCTVLSMFRC